MNSDVEVVEASRLNPLWDGRISCQMSQVFEGVDCHSRESSLQTRPSTTRSPFHPKISSIIPSFNSKDVKWKMSKLIMIFRRLADCCNTIASGRRWILNCQKVSFVSPYSSLLWPHPRQEIHEFFIKHINSPYRILLNKHKRTNDTSHECKFHHYRIRLQ